MRRVWLLRHGSTDSNERGKLLGWRDEPLSDAGRADVVSIRERIATLAAGRVWSSDLSRAVDTARLLTGREPRLDSRLREIDFGDLEGLTWDELSPAQRGMLSRFSSFEAPGGETVAQLRARVHSFLAELGSGSHLVVTHGGVIRLLIGERGDRSGIRPGELVKLEDRAV